MKECNIIENKLWFYIENQVDEVEKAKIKQHLEQCDSCRRIYFALSKGSEPPITLYNAENDPFFITGILQKIENIQNPLPVAKNRIHILRPLTVFAFIIIGCFLGFSIGNSISYNIACKQQKQEILKNYAQDNYYYEFINADVEQVLILK